MDEMEKKIHDEFQVKVEDRVRVEKTLKIMIDSLSDSLPKGFNFTVSPSLAIKPNNYEALEVRVYNSANFPNKSEASGSALYVEFQNGVVVSNFLNKVKDGNGQNGISINKFFNEISKGIKENSDIISCNLSEYKECKENENRAINKLENYQDVILSEKLISAFDVFPSVGVKALARLRSSLNEKNDNPNEISFVEKRTSRANHEGEVLFSDISLKQDNRGDRTLYYFKDAQSNDFERTDKETFDSFLQTAVTYDGKLLPDIDYLKSEIMNDKELISLRGSKKKEDFAIYSFEDLINKKIEKPSVKANRKAGFKP